MSAKKKAAPKKAAPKKQEQAAIHGANIYYWHEASSEWLPTQPSTKSRLRIGSIVRYKNGDVMIVLWRDEAESERKNVPDPKARYSWVGIHVSDPNYGWDTMCVSDKMLEDGEVEIIGHFDFFGLVNGNQNR